STAATTTPADTGLKRELGLIGAAWASETSIIGSGWLFAPLGAATLVGGTARFPHFAFGSGAGIGFGFFAYLQAVTIAPVECFAVMNYTSHWWHSIYN